MSGRLTKWVVLVILPLLLALYASYPPRPVVLQKERIVKRRAATAEEAEEHEVEEGDYYVAEREVLQKKWLPLAYGERREETRELARPEQGERVLEKTTFVEGRVKLGLDLAGGTELLYELKPREGQTIGGSLTSTIDILKKRIDPGNVKEYRIQALEEDRILIQVPEATTAEVEQLKGRLERMGKLEFKIAVPRGSQKTKFQNWYAQAEKGNVPEGYEKVHVDGDPSKRFFLIKSGDAEITGRYLARVFPEFDRYGSPAVGFEFDAIGSKRFARITENNLGWSLAIILDDVLQDAPQIEERIAGAGIIRGDFTQADVNEMVNILRAGSLPMDIDLLQESTVGPELGRDSIRRGLSALAVAGLLVVAFIGFYYLACGLIADGALIMNLVLLVGILSLLGAALTLPGMAGILLTVGMAVDANVLIFERIREESQGGKGVRIALRNGYDRAFTTIVDANVTTLLTAIILYVVGTGPVRGFAVTLSFGILLSMFTALVVTRLAFETLIDKGLMEKFRMFSLVDQPSLSFARFRKLAYVVSLIVVVLGMAAFFTRGSALYDIDFTGGSLVYVSLSKPTPVAEVRDRLEKEGFAGAEVQALQRTGAQQEGFTEFGVRFKGAGAQKVRESIVPDIRRRLDAAGLLPADAKVEVSADGRSVHPPLSEPVDEMTLRRALAEDDPFSLPHVGTIVPADDEDAGARRITVRIFGVPDLVEKRSVWTRALGALSWAGLETEEYTVEKLEATGEGSRLRLELDRPIEPELLAAELSRRGFAELRCRAAEDETQSCLLEGPPEALESFRTEFPAGAALRGVPAAEINGYAIRAALREALPESEIRVFFEKRDLPNVYIVAEELKTDAWQLDLSAEPIREKLRAVFADLARREGGVKFQPVSTEGDYRIFRMELQQPMAFSDVRHYIGTAGIGTYAEGIIVNEEQYGLETLVSELELRLPTEKAEAIQQKVSAAFSQPRPVEKVVSIGAVVAEELQGRAVLAVLFASVIIVLYVAVRFHALRFGVAAVIALLHDVLITAGLIALADWSGMLGDIKINLAMLAAFLTILGYSLNDTIVVFDRIRENMGILGRKRVSADLINMSINQTLSRTILTSMTTLMVVVVLFLLAGPVLRGLALTLIFGIIVGTYSSMFIASPVLLDWSGLTAGVAAVFRTVTYPVRLPFKLLGMAFGGAR